MKKVIKIFFNIIHYIILSYIELCCSYCYYKNIHCGHKLLEVNDEESLKKENISIEESKKEFNEIITRSLELNKKIEQQITEINNLYDKVNDEVTKSFVLKHEKQSIDVFVPIDIKCPEHPSVPLNLFCTDEKGN